MEVPGARGGYRCAEEKISRTGMPGCQTGSHPPNSILHSTSIINHPFNHLFKSPNMSRVYAPRRSNPQPSPRESILYFTCASNLHVALMARRCPNSVFRGPATLPHHIYVVDPRGMINIVYSEGLVEGQVEGLAYSVPIGEMGRLYALAPVTARQQQRVIFKPYTRLAGLKSQYIAHLLQAPTAVNDAMALAQDPQPDGEALIEEAVFHYTENFRVQADGMFAKDPFLVSLAIRDAIILGVPRQFYMTAVIPIIGMPPGLQLSAQLTILPTVIRASSQPIASRDNGSAPPGPIGPAMVSSTTGLFNAPDGILATPSIHTADGSIASGQPGSSNLRGLVSRGSVPHGTIDPTMIFSTLGPPAVSDEALARPGLNIADSGFALSQPSSSKPHGSVPSGAMSSKSEGQMVGQASVFSTSAPSAAHSRDWISPTPSDYTSHGMAMSQRSSSGPHGSVPTGSKRRKVDDKMVGRRTMSSTTQGKMVARQPGNPARRRMVSSQGSSSSALDRLFSTPNPSSAPSGAFIDSGGSLASTDAFLTPHTAPPKAHREVDSLTGLATATPPTPSATSSRPLPPATASMTGVRQRIRDTCSEMGIPLILASLQDGTCIPVSEEILDATYAVQVTTQLAWARTSFRVAAITQDRVLANELALDTLKEVLETAMKVNDEDLVLATTKHWLSVREGGEENKTFLEHSILEGCLRLDCDLGEGKGQAVIVVAKHQPVVRGLVEAVQES